MADSAANVEEKSRPKIVGHFKPAPAWLAEVLLARGAEELNEIIFKC
jgi:hypothetical protein